MREDGQYPGVKPGQVENDETPREASKRKARVLGELVLVKKDHLLGLKY